MNIINAIINLVNNPVTQLIHNKPGSNRANNLGGALEEYVQDLFADSFDLSGKERNEAISRTFSYLGNSSNPPDALIRGGDAIEVKKISTDGASLSLNSSYPKHTIFASSPMISNACRTAETWTEKDIIYVVGVVDSKKNNLRRLCMVYGLDYCVSDEYYSHIKNVVKEGVERIPNIEFKETRELGRAERVDPLGVTYFRVRGMWGIKNPWTVFEYIYPYNSYKDSKFDFMCIINDKKWDTLKNKNELIELKK
ncbi:MAG: NgoPII family restriction endonuclease, partial [Clostridiales bacterium]|nr:NgoPII family restriction endonuclease [Clostridiales bacterium]